MTITDSLVSIPRRLDFDTIVPAFSRAVSALDDASTAELDRAGVAPALREILRLRASQLNGCAYCVDLHSKAARTAGESEQRLHAVAIWRDSSLFTAAERAALELAESITRLSETHVPDATVAAALEHFGDDQTAALIALAVTINAWNAIGVSARCWSVRPDGRAV